MITKYYFLKKLYKDYLIIFITKNNKIKTYSYDKLLIKYINNINYICIDNEFNVYIKRRSNNMYYKYLIKEVIIDYLLKQGKYSIIFIE